MTTTKRSQQNDTLIEDTSCDKLAVQAEIIKEPVATSKGHDKITNEQVRIKKEQAGMSKGSDNPCDYVPEEYGYPDNLPNDNIEAVFELMKRR